MPLRRGQQPVRVRAYQRERGGTKVCQGTFDRRGSRNHRLASFSTQFTQLGLNRFMAKQIGRPRARQPNRLQRERVEAIKGWRDVVEVGAQAGRRVGFRADHANGGTGHSIWHQGSEFNLCGGVRLGCREPQSAMTPIVTLTHIRHPILILTLSSNISRSGVDAVPRHVRRALRNHG